jgi:hypothetical protein
MKRALVGMLLFAGAGCSTSPAPEPPVQKRQAAVTQPCSPATLPGRDPKKPPITSCTKAALPPVPATVIAKQAAYLAAWKKEAPKWHGLSAEEKEEKRRLLKESFLGAKGVTP